MNTLILLFFFAVPCYTRELISLDEIDHLLYNHVKQTLTPDDDVKLDKLFELTKSGFNEEIQELSQNRMVVACVICQGTLRAVFDLIREGEPEETIIETMTSLCINFGIMSPSVCQGAVKINIPIITYIVLNTPEATPSTACGLLLQSETNPNACPINDPRFEWTVELPPPLSKRNVNKVENADAANLKVVIISDIHVDPVYEPYGVANCDEPTCCRKGQKEALNRMYKSNVNNSMINNAYVNMDGSISMDLSFAEKIRRLRKSSRNYEARNSAPAGYWGDYRSCDTPIWAYDDAIERIKEAHKDIDMVYYIGDTIDHGVWETSRDLFGDINQYVVDKLRNEFGEDVPVIPVIGNHDSHPTNQFAPSRVTDPEVGSHWLYKTFVDKWNVYLDEQAKETLLDRGDFSIVIKPGLRIISLNTNVAYAFNWWLTYDPQDSKKHLDWLIEELHKAELAGEAVHLLTHIPSGVTDLTKTWSREYNRIIKRYSSTIKTEFNGHRHGDEFKIYYDSEGEPINVAWTVGGVTAYSNYNLNYKIATFDNSNYELLNIENYIYNLTEANLTPHRRPHWFQLYDFRNTYNVDSLSARDIGNLVYRMATTDKNLLSLYSNLVHKISDVRINNCDINCQADHLCRMVITELWERDRCEELRTIFLN